MSTQALAQAEIDALIARFFRAFDNRAGTPAIEDVTGCFADKAVIACHDGTGTKLYTAHEFAAPRIELLEGGSLRDFCESETESATRVVGGIATRTSRYVKSGLLDGAPYGGAGTKLFHLVLVDGSWRISSLAWQDDTP
ncbi:MAG: hypothetical protein ACXWJM_07030 [Ramlibacter sp.]